MLGLKDGLTLSLGETLGEILEKHWDWQMGYGW